MSEKRDLGFSGYGLLFGASLGWIPNIKFNESLRVRQSPQPDAEMMPPSLLKKVKNLGGTILNRLVEINLPFTQKRFEIIARYEIYKYLEGIKSGMDDEAATLASQEPEIWFGPLSAVESSRVDKFYEKWQNDPRNAMSVSVFLNSNSLVSMEDLFSKKTDKIVGSNNKCQFINYQNSSVE